MAARKRNISFDEASYDVESDRLKKCLRNTIDTMSVKRGKDYGYSKALLIAAENCKSFDYCKVLTGLTEILSSLTAIKLVSTNGVDNVFNQLNDAIPRIIVWGMQSWGKSTVLNIMFGLKDNMELVTCKGMATKCPVELRLGPNYEDTVYAFVNGVKTKVPSFQEAQNMLKSHSGLFSGTIVVEKKHETHSMIIVDLPGCNADASTETYAQNMRNYYLTKPNTTILHVVKAGEDPNNDISAKYLHGLDANVIKVLTHTDKCDDTCYIDQYIKHGFKVALVNNQKDECNIISNLNVKGDFINGLVKLGELSMDLLKKDTEKSIPLIKNLLNGCYQVINTEFEKIGRSKPDKRDVVYELQRYLREATKKQFEDQGTNYARMWNKTRDSLTKKHIYEYRTLIPEIKDLVEELKSGSRRTFKGSEGWGSIVKNNIKKIIEELKKKLVFHITNMMNITQTYCIQCVENNYNEYTIKIQDKLKKMVGEKCIILKKQLIIEFNSYLDTLANNPFDDSEIFIKILNDQMMKESHNLITKCIELQESGKPIKENLNELKQMLIKRKFTNSYTPKAQTAHRQLNSFWKSKSGEIHNTLNSYLSEYDEKVQYMCVELIDRIHYEDVVSSPELDNKRNMMRKLENDLSDLQKMLA